MKLQLKNNKVIELQMYNPNHVLKRNKSLCEMLKYEAKQFCLNTALHGYRFIILPKRILLERVIWLVIVLTSLITAITLLCIAWFSFQENPTVLVTDSTHFPIWFYPFPAVTVCSYNKISKKKALELAQNLTIKPHDKTINEIAWDFRLLAQLIHSNEEAILKKNYSRLDDLLENNEISVDTALQMLAPSCGEILQRCKWKGEEKRCESIFEQVKTTEGYCCAFNYFALKNHNFSGALPNKAAKEPRKVSACGYQTALEVLLNSDPDDYFAATFASIGHRVLLNSPYNFPDWTSQTMLNQMRIINLIGVNPTITYSTDNIKRMDLSKRKCMYHRERQLFNFKNYNFHNCIVECRMNISKRLCNCIPFYYYHANGTYPYPRICTFRELSCLDENRRKFRAVVSIPIQCYLLSTSLNFVDLIFSSVPGFDFNSVSINHKYGSEKGECDCLPDCEYEEYLAESSAGILNRDYSTNQLNFYGGVDIQNQSVIRVFFNDLVAIKNRRDVLFTWHTLLAYYGGLLGLFVGFSFVSGIEILYFFTIRLIADASNSSNNNKRNKEHVKVLHPNVQQTKKVNVQPTQFEHLDPKKLMLQVPENDQVRFRRNSNSWYIN